MLPSKLYKYEPFNEISLRNLKAQSIYFGSPKNFNDPYDCAITAPIQLPSTEDLAIIRKYYSSKKDDVPNEVRESLLNTSDEQLLSIFEKLGLMMFEFKDNKMRNMGVSCFSETNDNLIMWSHYGGRYKGFCLEFDTKFAPFTKAKKVRYIDEIPPLPIKEIMLEEGSDHLINLALMKSKPWAYENEWRVFHQESGTLFTYEPEALTGIYFGPEIARENLEIIALIMLGQNPNVKLYQSVRSSTEFKLEFTEFTYTTYWEAKKLGLRK